jgi:two-component system, NarL family, response regulator FusR
MSLPPASPSPIRVLVVDDHDVVRLGVRHLLGGRGSVREAGDLATALAELAREPADLLLLDLSLGEDFGLTALPRLRSACPGMRVVVLTSLAEDLYAERVLKAGADGFVSKSALASTLLEAVDTVLAGRVYVSAAMGEVLLRRLGSTPASRPELSPREIEVLRLVAAGRTTREIADMLNRSVKTVETHKQALKVKLGADSPAQLVRLAVHWFGEPM